MSERLTGSRSELGIDIASVVVAGVSGGAGVVSLLLLWVLEAKLGPAPVVHLAGDLALVAVGAAMARMGNEYAAYRSHLGERDGRLIDGLVVRRARVMAAGLVALLGLVGVTASWSEPLVVAIAAISLAQCQLSAEILRGARRPVAAVVLRQGVPVSLTTALILWAVGAGEYQTSSLLVFVVLMATTSVRAEVDRDASVPWRTSTVHAVRLVPLSVAAALHGQVAALVAPLLSDAAGADLAIGGRVSAGLGILVGAISSVRAPMLAPAGLQRTTEPAVRRRLLATNRRVAAVGVVAIVCTTLLGLVAERHEILIGTLLFVAVAPNWMAGPVGALLLQERLENELIRGALLGLLVLVFGYAVMLWSAATASLVAALLFLSTMVQYGLYATAVRNECAVEVLGPFSLRRRVDASCG